MHTAWSGGTAEISQKASVTVKNNPRHVVAVRLELSKQRGGASLFRMYRTTGVCVQTVRRAVANNTAAAATTAATAPTRHQNHHSINGSGDTYQAMGLRSSRTAWLANKTIQ